MVRRLAVTGGLLGIAMLFTASAAFAGDAAGGVEAGSAKIHRVRIEGMKFVPEVIEVAVGDTIVWENVDFVPHTATATSKGAAKFDSGAMPPKATFKFVAAARGTIPYVCTMHPGMKGTVQVR